MSLSFFENISLTIRSTWRIDVKTSYMYIEDVMIICRGEAVKELDRRKNTPFNKQRAFTRDGYYFFLSRRCRTESAPGTLYKYQLWHEILIRYNRRGQEGSAKGWRQRNSSIRQRDKPSDVSYSNWMERAEILRVSGALGRSHLSTSECTNKTKSRTVTVYLYVHSPEGIHV